MKGKICMVTGATSGIGAVTARELARLGATVILVGRDREKAINAVEAITRETGNPAVEYLLADLSSQKEVRGLAAEFSSRHDFLHVLVNNAGAMFTNRLRSKDGIEMTMALNHLGVFLLTELLLDPIKRAAPSRIVNVSSRAHENSRLDFQDLQNERGYSGMRAYGRSKLANLLFTYELARRLEGTGVTVNALHPGFVATNFGANNGGLLGRTLLKLVQKLAAIGPEEGARTTIYLASSPEVEGVTGKYFVREAEAEPSPAARDQEAAARLWEWSRQITGTPAAV